MPQLILTADGSHTLFIPELDEHYHSIHGALQESKHVFIEAGLKFMEKQGGSIRILEMGFGTGLNVFLTFLEAGVPVNYTAIEAHPVAPSLLNSLNYVSQAGAGAYRDVFEKLHSCEWNKEIQLSDHFIFTKVQTRLQDFQSCSSYDIVYYDAFAPRVQPELWTQEIFRQLHHMIAPGGILVTYCAKGEVKRSMKAAGFAVEALPGPKGKREMTRAVKRQP